MKPSSTLSNLSCCACAIALFCAATPCMCSLRNVLGLFGIGSGSGGTGAATSSSCSSSSSSSCTTTFLTFTVGFGCSSSGAAIGILLMRGFVSLLFFGLPLLFGAAVASSTSTCVSLFSTFQARLFLVLTLGFFFLVFVLIF